jgi:hypothetical protein
MYPREIKSIALEKPILNSIGFFIYFIWNIKILTSFSIEHTFLTKNYKRIRREIAFAKYPKFRQYTYQDLIDEAKLKKVDKLEVLENQEY